DVLPQLEIVYVPLGELRSPARNVRKIDPAHVREVAATISALRRWRPGDEPFGADRAQADLHDRPVNSESDDRQRQDDPGLRPCQAAGRYPHVRPPFGLA